MYKIQMKILILLLLACKTTLPASHVSDSLPYFVIQNPDDNTPDHSTFATFCMHQIDVFDPVFYVPYTCGLAQSLQLANIAGVIASELEKEHPEKVHPPLQRIDTTQPGIREQIPDLVRLPTKGSSAFREASEQLAQSIFKHQRAVARDDASFIQSLSATLESSKYNLVELYLKARAARIPEKSIEQLTDLASMFQTIGYESGFTLKSGGRIANQLKQFSQDATLIEYSLTALKRRRAALVAPIDPSTLKALDRIEAILNTYKSNIQILEGSYGKVMVGAALTKNMELARLQRAVNQGSLEKNLTTKIQTQLDKGIFTLDATQFSTEEIDAIKRELDKQPMAILARGSSTISYAHIARGEPGKTLDIKMKSEGETPYVPVHAVDSTKVVPLNTKVPKEETDQYQKLSNYALQKVMEDSLPVSVPVPDQIAFHDGSSGKSLSVFKSKYIDVGEVENTGWLTDAELQAGQQASSRKILYHGNPRTIEGANPALVLAWKNLGDKQLNYIYPNGVPKAKIFETSDGPFLPTIPLTDPAKLLYAQRQAMGFARFILERSEGKIASEQDVLARLMTAQKYVSDVDLASMASSDSGNIAVDKQLQHNEFGYYYPSHAEIIQYRDVGFTSLGMKPQILHPSELNNWYFPQALNRENEIHLVYSNRAGSRYYEIIRKPPGQPLIHTWLFQRIKQIYKDTADMDGKNGLNILFNARDFVDNLEDYKSVKPYLIPAQLTELQRFIDYWREWKANPWRYPERTEMFGKGPTEEQVNAMAAYFFH